MKAPVAAYLLLLSLSAGPLMAGTAFDDLSDGVSVERPSMVPPPSAPDAAYTEAEQYLPPDNDEPGFNWPSPSQNKSGASSFYIGIGTTPTYLKATDGAEETLAAGTGKCPLATRTIYAAQAAPVFEGDQIIVTLNDPLPGCSLTHGYVYMPHVSSTSAGGLWELPVNVRTFLDTLAFSEGTSDHYNYIFTYLTFKSYADHPRKLACMGKLCSTAAGRYQFLSKTWDKLAKDLSLPDFTPPNQEKATLEIIRRAGVYQSVEKSSSYKSFVKAVNALNTTWASLPGSPYGQPTHTMARLWKVYQTLLAGNRQ